MSEDLRDVEYGLPDKSTEKPRSPKNEERSSRKLLKLATVLMGLLAGLAVVLEVEEWVNRPLSPSEAAAPVWDGRLADVTGEDVLYRLEVTQAALKREKAVLGKLLSEEGVPLPEEAETTLALASLDVRQEQLDARFARLEADQLRLREVVMAYQLELARLTQQLIQQGQVLEGLRAGKGD